MRYLYLHRSTLLIWKIRRRGRVLLPLDKIINTFDNEIAKLRVYDVACFEEFAASFSASLACEIFYDFIF